MITEHHALFLLPVSVVFTQRVTLRPSSGNNQTDRWGQHCCRLSSPNRKLYCLSATWWILCVCERTPNRKCLPRCGYSVCVWGHLTGSLTACLPRGGYSVCVWGHQTGSRTACLPRVGYSVCVRGHLTGSLTVCLPRGGNSVCVRTPNRKSYCLSATWWILCVCVRTMSIPLGYVLSALRHSQTQYVSPAIFFLSIWYKRKIQICLNKFLNTTGDACF